MPHDVISTCPVCSGELAVTRLHCGSCGTTLEGDFSVGRFGRLTRDQLALLESFLRSRGNLRDMERELGISYPTVRSRVEQLVRSLGFGPRGDDEAPTRRPADAPRPATRQDILERLARHEIGAEEAAAAIRALGRNRYRTPPTTAPAIEHRIGETGTVTVRVASWDVEIVAAGGDTVRVRNASGAALPDGVEVERTADSLSIRQPNRFRHRHQRRPQVDREEARDRSSRPGQRRRPDRERRRPGRPAPRARQCPHGLRRRPARRRRRRVRAETVSGDVAIRLDAPTNLGIKTVSGDTIVEGGRVDRFAYGSTSGDLKLTSELGEGPHAIATVSGDAIVTTRNGIRVAAQT